MAAATARGGDSVLLIHSQSYYVELTSVLFVLTANNSRRVQTRLTSQLIGE